LLSLETYLAEIRTRMERALDARLPSANSEPRQLHRAMRYGTLEGGKRLRAALVHAAGSAFDASPAALDVPACALEMVHAYSLIHDDLPAMDDDDLRRGRPTVHRAFDEATAILAGDALLTMAFELLAGDPALDVSADVRLAMVTMLAEAAGTRGMAGGQAIDLAATGQQLDLPALQEMHARKTGALIRASVGLGARTAGVDSATRERLDDYAQHLGLAFQIVDDVLDIEGDTATLGKTQGSDQVRAKATYPALLGMARAKALADEHYAAALESLRPMGDNAELLRQLAGFVLHRNH